MKNCTGCKHAKWNRTTAGKLHPSGEGVCEYPVTLPPLPASVNWGLHPYWRSLISRHRDLSRDCTFFAKD